jgi:hypothetical protein
MGQIRSANGVKRNGKTPFEDKVVDARIILKLILNKVYDGV